ncbi:MAG: hypothetical protein MZV63_71340 [Marinilabiliales bacterium]|nr:hypothetical protein [Marinilabiliales bacterium]
MQEGRSWSNGLSAIGFRRQTRTGPSGYIGSYLSGLSVFRNIFTVLNVGLFAAAALAADRHDPLRQPSGSVKLIAILTGSFLAAIDAQTPYMHNGGRG